MFAIINQDTKRIYAEASNQKDALATGNMLATMFESLGHTFIIKEMTRDEIRDYRQNNKNNFVGKLTFYSTAKIDNKIQLVFLHFAGDTRLKLIFENEFDAQAYARRCNLEFIGQA